MCSLPWMAFPQRYRRSILVGLFLSILLSVYLIRYSIAVDLIGAFNYYVSCWHLKCFRAAPATKCITFFLRAVPYRYRRSVIIRFHLSNWLSIYLIRYFVAVDVKASFYLNIFCRHMECPACYGV